MHVMSEIKLVQLATTTYYQCKWFLQKIDKELETALANLDREKEEALKDLDAQVWLYWSELFPL